MQHTWKRPIVFSQRGSIQSIFVCVKRMYHFGEKRFQVCSGRQNSVSSKLSLFCEKPIAYIGNYQNEGVRKQILNVEGSFHSYIRIPEVMNWWPFSKTFSFFTTFFLNIMLFQMNGRETFLCVELICGKWKVHYRCFSHLSNLKTWTEIFFKFMSWIQSKF